MPVPCFCDPQSLFILSAGILSWGKPQIAGELEALPKRLKSPTSTIVDRAVCVWTPKSRRDAGHLSDKWVLPQTLRSAYQDVPVYPSADHKLSDTPKDFPIESVRFQ